jgi:hypothetical protein
LSLIDLYLLQALHSLLLGSQLGFLRASSRVKSRQLASGRSPDDPHVPKKYRFGKLRVHLELSWGHLGAMLSRLAAQTASREPHVAKTLFFAMNFNDFMMPSWAVLGGLGAILGLSWAVLGPS